MMQDILMSEIPLYKRLEQTDKPIVLYGMGDGADKIIQYLFSKGISISGVFASDDFVRGQVFRGFTVKTYAELKNEYGTMVVLIAFGTQRSDVLANIHKIASEQELYAPDLEVCGGRAFEPDDLERHMDEYNQIYERLADEKSKKTFFNILKYKISGKIHYLMDCNSNIDNDQQEFISPNKNDVYVDAGAYTGDTAALFADKFEYGKIYAIEPDVKNYTKILYAHCQLILISRYDFHNIPTHTERSPDHIRIISGEIDGDQLLQQFFPGVFHPLSQCYSKVCIVIRRADSIDTGNARNYNYIPALQ
jgi:hypothetical protein